MTKITAPYGAWASPITPEKAVAGLIRLSNICADGANVYWLEGRPNEGGRSVIVKRSAYGGIEDMTPAPFKDYAAPAGELPPCIVRVHGGPTSQARTVLDLGVNVCTSRGFAFVDVNYRGSTGYGRTYREALKGEWGIADVEDCVSAVSALVKAGLIDPNRVVIEGGSAGGYTTLRALTVNSVFKAGISYYGVADLEALMRDTHKFESHYLDGLVAPYRERADVYKDRSPIHHLDQLSAPLLLLQGLDDEIVPPNQAKMMAHAVSRKGLPVALILFEEEGHGFRKAANIRRALEAELYFLSRIFGFELAEKVPGIHIDNMS